MQTLRNSQQPHLPSSLLVSRRSAKTAALFQMSANGCLRRSPAIAGRYPQGKTSPSKERKQTPVPARQPLVMAFMAFGSPPGWPCGCGMPSWRIRSCQTSRNRLEGDAGGAGHGHLGGADAGAALGAERMRPACALGSALAHHAEVVRGAGGLQFDDRPGRPGRRTS